jgi:hypothetical protein
MNQPYVKETTVNEKGETVVTNPIPPSGYMNMYPNRKQRRAWAHGAKTHNCRKGRNRYQPRMKPVYDYMEGENGERVPFISHSVPDGTTICHRVMNR